MISNDSKKRNQDDYMVVQFSLQFAERLKKLDTYTRRKRFITLLLKILSVCIVYIDETSFNNGARYIWGYAKKGKRCIVLEKSRASERITVVGAQKQGKSQAMMVFKENMNKETFILWIKEMLIPKLKKGNIVIMDNASFHKDGIAKYSETSTA